MSGHKCLLCPKKNDIILKDAVQCSKCKSYYHKSCARRAEVLPDGSYQYCCKPRVAFDEEAVISQLDPSSKSLFLLLKNSFDSRFDKIDSSLCTINDDINLSSQRLTKLEDKVEVLEEAILGETIYVEVKERLLKEKNFIIYNYPDSVNASTVDLANIKKIFTDSGLDLPFELSEIKVARLGANYTQGKNRLVKVILKDADHVHWVFHKAKELFDDPIFVSSDLTKKQQAHIKKLRAEVKQRTDNGEKNLKIRHIRGCPSIVRVATAEEKDEEQAAELSDTSDEK